MARALLIIATVSFLFAPFAVTGALLHGRRVNLGAVDTSSPPPKQSRDQVRTSARTWRRIPTCQDHLAALRETDWQRTEEATDDYVAAGCDPQRALPYLIRYLRNPDVNIRLAADRALISYGPRARAAIPTLVAVLADPATKEWAPSVLIAIGPDAVPALTQTLSDQRLHVRRSAAFALGGIGAPARATSAKLLSLCKRDPSKLVRRTACWAVASIHELPAVSQTR